MTPLFILATLILLPVLYNVLVPLKAPDLEQYFQPGQSFHSDVEGVSQVILRQEGNKVYCRLTLAPHSAGPPEHVHLGFDEKATVSKGVLTVKLNNQTSTVGEGGRIHFPKGHYHTFSNTTDLEVVITCEMEDDYIPVGFVYTLAHFYKLMDSRSKFKMVHFFFKMALFGDLFDSYVSDVPIRAQKIIKKVLRPYARVLGYQLYDMKSEPVLSRSRI